MEFIDNKYISFWFENGILVSEFKYPLHLSLEIVKEIIELRHQISNNQPQYWCMNGTNTLSVSKDARKYADEFGQDFLFACSAVIDSFLGKTIYNTYLRFNKPVIPFHCVTKKEQAIEWLLELKSNKELV